jgi:hypothetical protein
LEEEVRRWGCPEEWEQMAGMIRKWFENVVF